MRYRGFENEAISAYFNWLLRKFEFGDDEICQYEPLLHQLFCMEFKYKIPKDWGRVSYGLAMREDFEAETGYILSDSMWNCSVLEVLLSLSQIISESIIGDPDEKNYKKKWFWTWINNLGLLDCKGDRYSRSEACIRLEIWMNRDFEPDGLGSPFPLKNPPCDQREAEIWKQAMLYLAEILPNNEY